MLKSIKHKRMNSKYGTAQFYLQLSFPCKEPLLYIRITSETHELFWSA